MCSELDVAKIISNWLFMTQSVACLLKHEIEMGVLFQSINAFSFFFFFVKL